MKPIGSRGVTSPAQGHFVPAAQQLTGASLPPRLLVKVPGGKEAVIRYRMATRVECLNQIRPGKICGAHLPAGKAWCPVCGERTTTRRVGSSDQGPNASGSRRTLMMQ